MKYLCDLLCLLKILFEQQIGRCDFSVHLLFVHSVMFFGQFTLVTAFRELTLVVAYCSCSQMIWMMRYIDSMFLHKNYFSKKNDTLVHFQYFTIHESIILLFQIYLKSKFCSHRSNCIEHEDELVIIIQCFGFKICPCIYIGIKYQSSPKHRFKFKLCVAQKKIE